MDALQLLREQAAFVEDITSRVLAEVTDVHAYWQPEGSAGNTIASTTFHIYLTEDRLVHRAQGAPPLIDGWQERLGVDPASLWTASDLKMDELRAYAAAVVANTRGFLETVQLADLEREIDTPRGKRTVATSLSLALVIHKSTHVGDVSALLGCQGLKGFPV